MSRRTYHYLQALAALTLTATLVVDRKVEAADHLDPSARVTTTPGNTADIADVFAWHTQVDAAGTPYLDGNLVVALTFAGPVAADTFPGDRDVLYGIHIDNNDAMHDPDVTIWARFGQDSEGNWGVRFDGIPGTGGPVVGRVGSIINLGGGAAYAGVREDPFFFDLQGFRDTLMTGNLAFDCLGGTCTDFFAGLNDAAIVVEIPLRAIPGAGPFRVWGTTGRI
jgi:hypothetical protein